LRPVAYASRTLSEPELHYAQIEKECLAAVWACEKFSQFLVGLHSFELRTDHKPLIPLIMTKDLDQVPIRCQRLLMRMMRFNPRAVYVPGKTLVIADTLSRAPLSVTGNVAAENAVQSYVDSITTASFSAIRLADVRRATASDRDLQSVMQYTLSGWPDSVDSLPENVKRYFSISSHLSISDQLLLYDDRIYIPQSLQPFVLDRIHDGHQGVTKCRERARSSVYWLGISQDIKRYVDRCDFCQQHRNRQQQEPLLPTALPSGPWQHIAADLFEYNSKPHLIVVDYYSRFFEFTALKKTTTAEVVREMQTIFTRWGIPELLITDNGPQFASHEFREFCLNYGFSHNTTSPHFPQANGEAERAVQTAKSILRQPDPLLALMVQRSTVCVSTGFSPAQLMLGRQIRTTLPVLPKHLEPSWPRRETVQANDSQAKATQQHYHDVRASLHPLRPLEPGEKVLLRTDNENMWGTTATVAATADTPRSYIVTTEHGTTLRRNRRHLRPIDTEQQLPTNDGPLGVSQTPPGTEDTTPATEDSDLCHSTVTTRSGRTVRPVQRLDL